MRNVFVARYTSGDQTYTCPNCDLVFDHEHLINPDPTPMTKKSLMHARAECPRCDGIMRIIEGVAYCVVIDMHHAYG